jgi:small subunit ribosomal protein S4
MCRREGLKLFLKGARCDGPKCALARRDTVPGQHGYRRRARSEYALRLREKQRAKRYYGLRDAPFMRIFRAAAHLPGDTGQTLFTLLERRLDNVVYRAGLAMSRALARQLITHGHLALNGKRADRPSILVKPGDVLTPWGGEKNTALLLSFLDQTKDRQAPAWIEVQREPLEVRMTAMPPVEEATSGFQPHLIVEVCRR